MRLLMTALRNGDSPEAVLDLAEQTSVYVHAAYEAGRMRVDEISMSLLNRPAAELYVRTNRVELKTTTMRAPDL